MQKKLFRMLALATAVLMMAISLGACATASPTPAPTTAPAVTETPMATPTVAPTPTPLPTVTLRVFFPGTEPPMLNDVWNAVADMTKDKLNATFEINFVDFGDYASKIQALTAAGDNYDANFDADWFCYPSMVNKGAYLALNDLMPQYAPNLYKIYQQEGAIGPCSVEGKLYGIPWVNQSSSRPVFVYRKDLLSQFGLAPNTDFSTLEGMEKYLYAAKKADPNSYPITWSTADPGAALWPLYAKYEMDRWDFHMLTIDLNDPAGKLIPIEQTPMFKEAVETAKKWVDDGIIPKDMLSMKQYPAFSKGEEVSFVHILDSALTTQKPAGAEVGYSIMYSDKKYKFNSPMNNAMVINKNAANPERTLMFLDLITTDGNVYDTVIYGIQGKTYDLQDGKVMSPAGVDATQPQYLNWSGQWGFWRSFFFKPDQTRDATVYSTLNDMLKMPSSVVSPITGFIPNTDSIKTQIAKRDELFNELGNLLVFGEVNDVDKALEDYIQKQKDAGLDQIIAALQPQVDAFIASNKK